MDDVAVLLEHVDLLDTLDGLDVQLLQGGLQLLVVGVGGPVDLLDLAAGSALASVSGNSLLVGIRSEFEYTVHGMGGEFEIVGHRSPRCDSRLLCVISRSVSPWIWNPASRQEVYTWPVGRRTPISDV